MSCLMGDVKRKGKFRLEGRLECFQHLHYECDEALIQCIWMYPCVVFFQLLHHNPLWWRGLVSLRTHKTRLNTVKSHDTWVNSVRNVKRNEKKNESNVLITFQISQQKSFRQFRSRSAQSIPQRCQFMSRLLCWILVPFLTFGSFPKTSGKTSAKRCRHADVKPLATQESFPGHFCPFCSSNKKLPANRRLRSWLRQSPLFQITQTSSTFSSSSHCLPASQNVTSKTLTHEISGMFM